MYFELVTWISELFNVIRPIKFIISIIVQFCKKSSIFVYISICCVGAGLSTLYVVHFWPITFVLFPSEVEKTLPIGEEMDAKVFFSSRVGMFCLYSYYDQKVFSVFALIWRVNNYVSRQRKDKNRSENAINILIILYHCTSLSNKNYSDSVDCRWLKTFFFQNGKLHLRWTQKFYWKIQKYVCLHQC